MRMTFLAKEGWARLEQASSGRAMRLMTDAAIFRHGLMVVHERSALLHVARVAGLVGAGLDELLRVVAVHVVARRAGHLAFDDGVV